MVLALLPGCVDAPTDPRAAARLFFDHLERGEADAVWGLLIPSDQTRLRAHQAQLAAAEGRAPSEDPSRILRDFGIRQLGRVDGVTVASRPGDSVEVRVTLKEGESATFRMDKQPTGVWKLGLLDALE
ncbi:MAG: hypothetical protein AAFU79_05325, partial [Myxococcota bacterium]